MSKLPIRLNLDLTGDEGNILIVVAKTERLMRSANVHPEAIKTMRQNVLAANTYTAALGEVANWIVLNDGIFEGMK